MENPLLGRRAREGRVISPRVGGALLVAASALFLVAEITLGRSAGDRPVLVADEASVTLPTLGEKIGGLLFPAELVPVAPDPNAPKVPVKVYMESMCKGCEFFTSHILAPVLRQEGMKDIIDLQVVASGNAKWKEDEETKQQVVSCQHGEAECEGNKFVACLNKHAASNQNFVPVLRCVEGHAVSLSGVTAGLFDSSKLTVSDMVSSNAKLCVESENTKIAAAGEGGEELDMSAIEVCMQGEEGQQLLAAALDDTLALKPEMDYAPWVVVDGIPLKEDAYSLKEYICKAYKGVKPAECNNDYLKDYYPPATLKAVPHGRMSGQVARQQLNQFFDTTLVGGRQEPATATATATATAAAAGGEPAGKQQLLQWSALSAKMPFQFCARHK